MNGFLGMLPLWYCKRLRCYTAKDATGDNLFVIRTSPPNLLLLLTRHAQINLIWYKQKVGKQIGEFPHQEVESYIASAYQSSDAQDIVV
jgi:hypothetical protein